MIRLAAIGVELYGARRTPLAEALAVEHKLINQQPLLRLASQLLLAT